MRLPGLSQREVGLVVDVLRRHSEVTSARVFGSRAKGTHTPGSDVDVAIWGDVDALEAEAIAAELDELPLPYRFEVRAFDLIELRSLREHIERVGIPVFAVTTGV